LGKLQCSSKVIKGVTVGLKPKSTDTVELWGRKFKRAKNGLDGEEIASFVSELITERDRLIKQQEHLTSLTKLAERTVAEADELAKQDRKEAIDQARTEANAIVAKAKEQAQHIIEEKRAEAEAIVNKEAEAIKAKAKQQAELLLEETAKRIQPELRDRAQRLYRELRSQLEGLRQQVIAFETESDHKLSQLPEEVSTGAVKDDKTDDKFQELILAAEQTDEGEPAWELQILPPIDIMQTLQIVTYLDSLPEVKNTELIPQVDQALITVFLHKPIQLVSMLKALPQVAEVKEEATEAEGSDSKPMKVQIMLAGKNVSPSVDHSPIF
jgi:cell division septum initiation protein DivIVA